MVKFWYPVALNVEVFTGGSANVPTKAKLLMYNPSGSQDVGVQYTGEPAIVVQLTFNAKPVFTLDTSEVNLTVNEPVIEVIRGIVKVPEPLYNKVPPVPIPSYIYK